MWKDWGLAGTLYSQAERFLDLAKQTAVGSSEQEGYIRASLVFCVMSFEAFFFREIIMGYIQNHRADLDAANVKKVEEGLYGTAKGGFTGVTDAVKKWPGLLTGAALNTPACDDLAKLLEYRNALSHGDITRQLPKWGKLAQEVETTANAELALEAVAKMKKAAALHFGFPQLT